MVLPSPPADPSAFTCGTCGKVIGHLMPHPKYPALVLLNLGNQNIAENFHGRCGVCGTGVHFDWRWELAARAFGSSAHKEAILHAESTE